ncbi:hypothetical protein [Ideonella sp. YS5]|uniref:hypothetical protein n=1 Tax=Ideonella sp. YS5 TaxID=3453714 RepID=UPI003EEF7E6B
MDATQISAHISAIISAAAGIVGVLVGNTFVAVKEKRVRRQQEAKDLTYLAILVVSHLDRFANDCELVARDDGTEYGRPAGNDGEYFATTVKAPEFLPLDIKVEWKVLPSDLMYSILEIPDRRERLQSYLVGFAEHGDHDGSDYIFERQLTYARLGLDVSVIARKLRKHANLPIEKGSEHRDRDFKEIIGTMEAKKEAYEKAMSIEGPPLDLTGVSLER